MSVLVSLPGPMLRKELRHIARPRRFYALLVVYCLAVLAIWVAHDCVGILWILPEAHERTAAAAREMFSALCNLQFFALVLFVPPLIAGAVVGERETGTLDLLLTTQLADGEIIFARFASRLAVVALTMAGGLPMVFLILMLGGVDVLTLLRAQAVILVLLLVAGSVSIYCSCTSNTTLGATLRSYAALLIWLFAFPALVLPAPYLLAVAQPWSRLSMIAASACSPGLLLTAVADRSFDSEVRETIGNGLLSAVLAFWFIVSIAILRRSCARLRGDVPRRVSGDARRTCRPALPVRSRSTADAPPDSGRGGLTAPRYDNPLYRRAVAVHVYDGEGYVRRTIAAAWVAIPTVAALVWLSLVASDWAAGGHMPAEGLAMFTIVPAWALAALLATVIAGSSLAGDRQRRFLESVVLTPLEPREIVDGTLLATWLHVRWAVALGWALTGALAILGVMPPEAALVSASTGTLCVGVLAVHGVAASLVGRTSAEAIALAAVLTAIGAAAVPIFLWSIQWSPAVAVAALASVGLPTAILALIRTPAAAAFSGLSIGLLLLLSYVCLTAGQSLMHAPIDGEFAAIDPSFWIVQSLEHFDWGVPRDWSSYFWPYQRNLIRLDQRPPYPMACVVWAGLAAHAILIRSWTVRQFDWLVRGRH